MGKLTGEEVKHIAKLSKLDLTTSELTKFQNQLSDVLNYIGQLSEVDISNYEPTSQTTGLENIFRKDDVNLKSFTQEEVLSGSDKTHNGYFVVDAILDKEK